MTRSAIRGLARPLLAAIFVRGGYRAFQSPGHRPAQAAKLGLPESGFVVRANGLAMTAAGAALAAGIAQRAAAAVLAASLVPTTLAGHRFWEEDDDTGREAQLIHALKNLGLLGGLLLVMAEES